MFRFIGSFVFRLGDHPPMDHQIVFLVGPPRSGSTILYQAITNFADVSYIDNLACWFRDSLFFGMLLSHFRYGKTSHDNFYSELGATSKYGLHSPSECGEFWYRWFPRDPHYVESSYLTPRQIAGLTSEACKIVRYFRRPFVVKNLVCGQRLRVLAKVFPEAKVIVIKRDDEDVIRSILKARKALSIPTDTWWSVKPRGYERLIGQSELEMICGQVDLINSVIDEDIRLFRPENVKIVHYENFDKDLVEELATWIGARIKLPPSNSIFHRS
ncbi:sulfotransferase [Celeribacter marinus]|uniref:sulfotransferase n=1 Tax=Celeribacter marinus TaxID=1397108 RepID=UPI00319EB070